MKPTLGEIAEAKHFPDGWVYRIHTGYDPNGRVPPEAIVGAWRVDRTGKIMDDFKSNPNYDPIKCDVDLRRTNKDTHRLKVINRIK